MESFYETPQAFDRALKRAIAASGGNRGERYRQMLRDRFLCRVFSAANNNLVLKGGSGLLARIPDARATRDIDFGNNGSDDAQQVLDKLNAAVARDLGDWCRFELTKCEETLDENGYSRLLKLRYSTHIGEEEKDPILIDLSLDCATTAQPELIAPLNRVEVDGIATCDYLVYPLPDQLADKLCAIMELQPGGYLSSRMKDLVDVVAYASNEVFDLGELSLAIRSECARRQMAVPTVFVAPETWRLEFARFARKHGVVERFVSFEAASALASEFFNPALEGTNEKASWDPCDLCWKSKEQVF